MDSGSFFYSQQPFQFTARSNVTGNGNNTTSSDYADSTAESVYLQHQHQQHQQQQQEQQQQSFILNSQLSFLQQKLFYDHQHDTIVADTDSSSQNAVELTRNDKYRVSRLNATPSILNNITSNASNEHINSKNKLRAYVDQHSKHACISSEEGLSVWNYASVDSSPITYTIKTNETDNNKNGHNSHHRFTAGENLQRSTIPVLVLPSPGVEEPGLVAIDTHTGDIRYYEYISSDSSVSLIRQKDNVSHKIDLHHGEYITMYENVEPVGIVVATSEGRAVLISLRDSAGKPNIKCSNIISSSFFPFFRARFKIVSIKAGKNLGHGARSLSILTDNGTFMLWSVARDGQAIKLYETSLYEHLLNEIKDLYDTDHINILDSYPLSNLNEDAFLVLTSIQVSHQETCYILFTLKKDGRELLTFSAYRLTRYTLPSATKPKLFLPKPNVTAFIVFDDAVVLLDVVTKLDHSLNEKRKWEDIISFRSGVNIIGAGYEDFVIEDGKVANLPSIIVITQEAGVLKIERCNEDELKHSAEQLQTPSGNNLSSSFTKSHIEQAVFYGYSDSNPLSFNVPENVPIEDTEIDQALIEVGNDLVNSKSAYLPPRMVSVENHLNIRLLKLQNLVDYTASNFLNDINIDTKTRVVFDLEKINGAYKIWPIFEQAFSEDNQELIAIFADIIRSVIGDVDQQTSSSRQIIENFFYHHVSKLGLFLSQAIQKLLKSSNPYLFATAVALVLRSIKEGAIDIETAVRENLFHMSKNEVGSNASWIVENDLCFRYNELFHSYFDSVKDLANNSNDNNGNNFNSNITSKVLEISSNLVSLVSVLFFSFSYNLSFLTSQTLTKATREEIQKYKSVYETNRGSWIRSLVQFGEMNAALQLAENFEDLHSLVEICDNERERAISNDLDDTYVKQRFDGYFNKFGYKFAETLYNYYVFSGKLQELLLSFPEYNAYLKRFLKSGDHGRIMWIRNILDAEYFDGAYTLYSIANKADDLVSNKRLQLSLAKLSLLASSEGNPNAEDILIDIENGLIVLEIQDYLYDEVSKYRVSDNDNDIFSETDKILSLLTDNLQKRNGTVLYANLRKPLSKLLQNKSVELNELIDLYTLLDIRSDSMKLNYYKALKLIGTGLLTYSEKKISEILVWRRAILSDNWKEIGALGNAKSSEFVQHKIENSVLYITLYNCFKDNLFSSDQEENRIKLPDVNVLIQPIHVDDLAKRFKNLNQKSLFTLSEELNKEAQLLKEVAAGFDFETYVKGIIGTAQANSSSREVVNYRTLEFA